MKKLLLTLIMLTVGIASNAQITNPAPYCAGGYGFDGCGTADYVRSFTFATLSNLNTACTAAPYYSFYQPTTSNLTTTVIQGLTYTMTVTGATTKPNGFGVWIDYNRDFDFDDAGELVYFTPAGTLTNGALYTANITIPANAPTGQTRLRVRANWNNFTGVWTPGSACSSPGDWGETEDYTIQVGNPSLQPPNRKLLRTRYRLDK